MMNRAALPWPLRRGDDARPPSVSRSKRLHQIEDFHGGEAALLSLETTIDGHQILKGRGLGLDRDSPKPSARRVLKSEMFCGYIAVQIVFRCPAGEFNDGPVCHGVFQPVGEEAPNPAGHLLFQGRPRQQLGTGLLGELHHGSARRLDRGAPPSCEIGLGVAMLEWPPNVTFARKCCKLFSQFRLTFLCLCAGICRRIFH